MLGMNSAGTAVVCVVAILAATLLVADVIASIKHVRVARIDAETARLRRRSADDTTGAAT